MLYTCALLIDVNRLRDASAGLTLTELETRAKRHLRLKHCYTVNHTHFAIRLKLS